MSRFQNILILAAIMTLATPNGSRADSQIPAPNQSKIDYANSWKAADDQGKFGTCAIFTTIGLLEAEYLRTFGEKINFSQGDLWLHLILGNSKETATNYLHQILNQQVFSQWTAHGNQKVPGFLDKRGLFGAGEVETDFALAQQIGLKTAEVSPYTKAENFFIGLQDALKSLPSLKPEDPQIQTNPTDTIPSVQDFFLKLLGKEDTELNRIYDSTRNFSPRDPTWLSRIQMPAIEGVETMNDNQKRTLITKLLTCKPVGVDMTSDYYFTHHGEHAEIIAGYDPKSDKFEVRNSWGKPGIFSTVEHAPAKKYLPHVTTIHFIQDPLKPCL